MQNVMRFDEKMKFSVPDNMMLQFYGVVLLIVTLNTWISISGIVLIPLLWIAALCAVIVYHRQLKLAILSFEWNIRIWFSLFFPKSSDPVVTNIGKMHWLILCLLWLFGVDSLVTPIHISSNVSSLGKRCWVISLVVAVALSVVIIKYRSDKK